MAPPPRTDKKWIKTLIKRDEKLPLESGVLINYIQTERLLGMVAHTSHLEGRGRKITLSPRQARAVEWELGKDI